MRAAAKLMFTRRVTVPLAIALVVALTGPVGALTITEIMYNPPGGGEYEFVELHNSGTFDVPLGWHRFDGIDFTFAGDAVIGPGEFLVLASDNDPDAFKLRYPGLAGTGWFRGSRSNNGERLALLDARWRRVVEVDYSDGGAWSGLADGDGHSLELIDPLADPGAASNWRDSAAKAGSPGTAGADAADPPVVINEVHVQSPFSPEPDFVELRNLGQVAVDLSGWTLRDGDGNTFGFPDGTALGQAGLLDVAPERLAGELEIQRQPLAAGAGGGFAKFARRLHRAVKLIKLAELGQVGGLRRRERRQRQPAQRLVRAKAQLPHRADPELHLHLAQANHVTIVQSLPGFQWLVIDQCGRLRNRPQ